MGEDMLFSQPLDALLWMVADRKRIARKMAMIVQRSNETKAGWPRIHQFRQDREDRLVMMALGLMQAAEAGQHVNRIVCIWTARQCQK